MKTIGVIGGLGPQATYDFERRVHLVSQSLIPPKGNTGYPPMVVFYHRNHPIIFLDDGTPRVPFEPNPDLIKLAANLGPLVDFIVITSNGVHFMQPYIEQASGKKVLSIVDLTLAEVERRSLKNVGVMEYRSTGIYQRPLEARNTPFAMASEASRKALDGAIEAYTEGRHSPELTAIALKAIEEIRAQGTDGIIMGCTEIPLMLEGHAEALDLINPAQLLADAAVRYAIEA